MTQLDLLVEDGLPLEWSDLPFLVALGIAPEQKFEGSCGGVLVDPKWVLTVTHCLPKAVFAKIGRTDLQEPGGDLICIKSVVRHPEECLAMLELHSPSQAGVPGLRSRSTALGGLQGRRSRWQAGAKTNTERADVY